MAIRKIILLRRDYPDLTEMTALQELFPDDDLHFIRTDPVDHLEHDLTCWNHGAGVVLLPREKPIPATAMARGVRHLALMPNGKLKRLVRITPMFADP